MSSYWKRGPMGTRLNEGTSALVVKDGKIGEVNSNLVAELVS
jgi:hypothetical protein